MLLNEEDPGWSTWLSAVSISPDSEAQHDFLNGLCLPVCLCNWQVCLSLVPKRPCQCLVTHLTARTEDQSVEGFPRPCPAQSGDVPNFANEEPGLVRGLHNGPHTKAAAAVALLRVPLVSAAAGEVSPGLRGGFPFRPFLPFRAFPASSSDLGLINSGAPARCLHLQTRRVLSACTTAMIGA